MSAQPMSFGTIASYYATYTVDAEQDMVTHHVLGAPTPGWVGEDWPRLVSFTNEGELILRARNEVAGFEADLTWRRVIHS